MYGRKYYFLTVADTKSITRAAEILHVSQPSLSQYISALERKLDVKLLDRSVSPLALTKYGEIYDNYLRAAYSSEQKMLSDIAAARDDTEQPLIVGMPLQVSPLFMSTVLPHLRQISSRNISFLEGTSLTVKRKVLSGEIEVGFAHTMRNESGELAVHPLEPEHVVMICSKNHPVVAGADTSPEKPLIVSPEQLEESMFFLMSKEYFLHGVSMDYLRSHRITAPRHTILSNLSAILSTICNDSGNCVAFMPDFMFRGFDRMSDLAFIRFEEPIDWDFSILWRKDRKLSPAMSQLRKETIRFYNGKAE